MNDFRMMIFIEEYIGDALKKGRSEKFCIKKLNDYLEPPMLQLRRVCQTRILDVIVVCFWIRLFRRLA